MTKRGGSARGGARGGTKANVRHGPEAPAPEAPADEPKGGTDGPGSKRRTTKEEVEAITEWFEMEETRDEHDPLSGAVKTLSTKPNYDWYHGINQQDGVDGQKARTKTSAQREGVCPVEESNAAREPVPIPDPPSDVFPFFTVRPIYI